MIDPAQTVSRPSTLAITQFIEDQHSHGHEINPTIMHYRMFAQQLSKKHNIPFDLKTSRKKKKVVQWLDQHWGTVGNDFLVLLGGIESIFRSSRAQQALPPLSDESDSMTLAKKKG
jgi:hypothetical protein